jgi:UDP-2,4-diacetamido-2,4,6-trideoxy-beta-L-altropyranose hydrolase
VAVAAHEKFPLVIRADAGHSIGLGHVSRCLALAAMLRNTFRCTFAIHQPDDWLCREIGRACEAVADTAHTPFPELLNGNELVVLDGYHFDTQLQQLIKDKGCVLTCIDDLHQTDFVADLIINHAPLARQQDYRAAPYTRFALGTDYALINPEFLHVETYPAKAETQKIFICFGGADANNLTCTVLTYLSRLSFSGTTCVVTGASYRHEPQLMQLKATLPFNVETHKSLPARDMARVMSACDLAIVPSSSILYEVMALRMPVISGWYVANQQHIYNGFLKSEAIIGADDFNFASFQHAYLEMQQPDAKKHLIRQQEKVIDKRSPERLLNLFLSLV